MQSTDMIRSIAQLGDTCPELGLPVHRDPVWRYRGSHAEIVSQCDLEDGQYFYIADVTELKRASLKARRRYYDCIRAWYKQHPFRAYVFHGARPHIRAAINVARHFVDFDVAVVNDRKAALDNIRQSRLIPSSCILAWDPVCIGSN